MLIPKMHSYITSNLSIDEDFGQSDLLSKINIGVTGPRFLEIILMVPVVPFPFSFVYFPL